MAFISLTTFGMCPSPPLDAGFFEDRVYVSCLLELLSLVNCRLLLRECINEHVCTYTGNIHFKLSYLDDFK